MLVHICCSVDSHFFLQKLKQKLPNEKLIGYFYDPNIHPYSEYLLRYEDVLRSCEKLKIPLMLGDYDYEEWLSGTKGLEDEPEKGKRCVYCFDFRIKNAAQKAVSLGEKSLTTTLLMSPKKDFSQLEKALKDAVLGTDIQPYAVDFRINGGTNEQFLMAKTDKLYHQNYCGCIFGLSKQRKQQNIPTVELMSEINARMLPNSIEYRLNLYRQVKKIENQNINFDIKRRYFLNYRLLMGLIKHDKITLCSYFMLYSHFKRKNIKFNLKQDEIKNSKAYTKEGIILLSLDSFNDIAGTNYNNTLQICKNPLDFEFELEIRRKLSGDFSTNPIIVIDKIQSGKYEIFGISELYQDSYEIIELS